MWLGLRNESLVIGDMPFMSYQAGLEEALRNAGRFLQAGAQAIKLEGGAVMADRVTAMTSIGIPVMGHLGMTPQSVHRYGGYKVQGKESDHAQALVNDAKALEAAGAFAIVLEAVPAELAKTITERVAIPTIGIGAGPHCDGQVLVLYDLLGLFDDFVPKFVKPYAHLKADALQALRRYKEEVEDRANFRAIQKATITVDSLTSRLPLSSILADSYRRQLLRALTSNGQISNGLIHFVSG